MVLSLIGTRGGEGGRCFGDSNNGVSDEWVLNPDSPATSFRDCDIPTPIYQDWNIAMALELYAGLLESPTLDQAGRVESF